MSRLVVDPTDPPILCVPAALSLAVKRLGHEADHSPPSSAEIKNSRRYTSIPPYVFMAWCIFKHRKRRLHFEDWKWIHMPVERVSGMVFR
jgi:hypothetical protein